MKARILVGVQFALLGLLYFVRGEELVAPGSAARRLPPYLYVMGTILFVFAYLALRPSLRVSPIPREGAALIVHGIYRWMRHPMYVAVLLFGAGMALGHLSWLSIGLWLLLLVDLMVKANYEDKLLSQVHQSAADYQRSARGILLTKKNEKRI